MQTKADKQGSARVRVKESLLHAGIWFSLVATVGVVLLIRGRVVLLGVEVATGVALLPFALWFRSIDDLVSPIYLTAAYLLLAYPIKLLAVRYGWFSVVGDYPGLLKNDRLAAAVMWLSALGTASYLMGFGLGVPLVERGIRKCARWLRGRWGRSDIQVPTFGALLGVFALGALVISGEFVAGAWSVAGGGIKGPNWSPALNQIATYSEYYLWIGYLGLLYWLFAERESHHRLKRLLAVVCIACALAYGVSLGSKRWFVFPFVWMVIVAVLAGRRRTAKELLLGGMIALIAAFATVGSWRTLYGRGNVTELSPVATGHLTVRAMSLARRETNVTGIANRVLTRFGGADNLAKTVVDVPSRVRYRQFIGMTQLAYFAVPRALVPGKPNPAVESTEIYTRSVAGMRHGGKAAPHPFGEGYFNAGVLGIVLLSWLWGVSHSVLYKGFLGTGADSAVVAVLYAFFLLRFIGFGGWLIPRWVALPNVIIMLVPAIGILRTFSTKGTVRDQHPATSATS